MSSSKKLTLNTKYLIYTKYNSVPGLEMEVVGILTYSEAKDLPFSITTIAINEKVVDSVNTDTYLLNQFYYKCIYRDSANNEVVYLLWDDIIDSDKTTQLTVQYKYNLLLTINSGAKSGLNTMIDAISTYISTTYGSTVDPKFISLGIVGKETSSDETLEEYKTQLETCKTVINKLASLKQIETLINYFAKDDMAVKIEEMSKSLSNIESTVSTISSLIN